MRDTGGAIRLLDRAARLQPRAEPPGIATPERAIGAFAESKRTPFIIGIVCFAWHISLGRCGLSGFRFAVGVSVLDRVQAPFVGHSFEDVVPCSDVVMPEPTRSAFTASETNTSAGPARSQMRLVILTVARRHRRGGPRPHRVDTGAHLDRCSWPAVTISTAARTARVVASKVARNPSPVVLTS